MISVLRAKFISSECLLSFIHLSPGIPPLFFWPFLYQRQINDQFYNIFGSAFSCVSYWFPWQSFQYQFVVLFTVFINVYCYFPFLFFLYPPFCRKFRPTNQRFTDVFPFTHTAIDLPASMANIFLSVSPLLSCFPLLLFSLPSPLIGWKWND